MVSVVKGFLHDPAKTKNAEEDPESLAEWRRGFLSVVEEGNDIEKLRQCLTALSSCSSRFNDEADEHAKTNRGNFILQTLHNSNEKCVRDMLSDRAETQDTMASLKNQGYFTPYFLRDGQAVRCLVQEKCRFGLPDGTSDGEDDDLDEALTSINRYFALADPIYLSACFLEADPTEEAIDPIWRSFQLHRKLLAVAEKEYEFKSEYNKLRERCNNFAVDVLEECRKLEPEIRCVLQSAGSGKQNDPLDILHLAILNENKQFVSHPYSQLLLNAEIYRGIPSLKRESNLVFFGVLFVLALALPVLLPVLPFLHVFCPQNKLAMMANSPQIKFLIYVIMYLAFIAILIQNTTRGADELLTRHSWVIDRIALAWFTGLAVDIVTDLAEQTKRVRYKLGTSWMKSFAHVLATGWNTVAMVFVLLTIPTQITWAISWNGLTEQELDKLKNQQTPSSPMFSLWLIAIGLYSLIWLLALIYTASFFVVNSYMGPLLHALVEMVKEVLKFFLFFSLLYFAFSFSFRKLYLQYSHAVNSSSHTSVAGTMYITFWALFGAVDNEEFKTEPGYETIEYGGLSLFGIYSVVAVLVVLNMLIAILNDAYIKITEDLDTDWKFARSAVWMNWIHKEEAIPPPFNLVSILLKLLKRIRKWISPEKHREVLQDLVQKYLDRERKTESFEKDIKFHPTSLA